jgi:alpha-L-fucosidase
MDTPASDISITSLGLASPYNDRKIKKITMPGSEEKLKWKQNDDALVITLPAEFPGWKVVIFKIELR